MIPINQTLERLWPLMKAILFNNKFWLNDGYPEMIRIGFGDLGEGIMY